MLRSLGLAAFLGLVVGAAGPAQAISTGGSKTFEQLLAGESLTSGDGSLLFSDFELPLLDSLPQDLSLYTVTALSDGIRIEGPLAGGVGGIRLGLVYTVTALGQVQIEDAHLGVFASGGPAVVDVHEALYACPVGAQDCGPEFSDPLATMLARIVDVPGGASDEAWFGPVDQLRVYKTLLAESTPESEVLVDYVDQRFSLVPEPTGLGLLGLGIVGLWRLGRRR